MDGVKGGWGVPPTYMCMHACTRTHIYTLNMIISIANCSPHWGNPWEFPMMSYAHVCACTCTCMCMGVGGTLFTTPTPIHPGGTLGISQNSIALELIEIFEIPSSLIIYIGNEDLEIINETFDRLFYL